MKKVILLIDDDEDEFETFIDALQKCLFTVSAFIQKSGAVTKPALPESACPDLYRER